MARLIAAFKRCGQRRAWLVLQQGMQVVHDTAFADADVLRGKVVTHANSAAAATEEREKSAGGMAFIRQPSCCWLGQKPCQGTIAAALALFCCFPALIFLLSCFFCVVFLLWPFRFVLLTGMRRRRSVSTRIT